MPLTRNQRNSQTSSPNASDQNTSSRSSSQDATKSANTSASSATAAPLPDNSRSRSPSPKARSLRDRRSLTTIKPFGETVPSDYILHRPTQKRPPSITPPSKKEPKLQSETAQASSPKALDKIIPPTLSQNKSTQNLSGLSLLQKLSKPGSTQPTKTAQGEAPVKSTRQADVIRHDYSRIKPPVAPAPPKTIEGILHNAIRAKLLSNNSDNPRIDLSARISLPADGAAAKAPVRITLPPSPSKTYDHSLRSESPRSSFGESRQIEVMNLNSSLLRRHQSTSSGQSNSPRHGAINLTTSNRSTPDASSAPAEKFFNVIIAVTGSVAAIKLVNLVQVLKSKFPKIYVSKADGKEYKANISIQIILTENAKHFLPSKLKIFETLRDLTISIHDDADEWSQWKKMGDPVLHIELRKWADLMVIAPLDANTMAKISTGICDNLLTCVVRAWDLSKKLLFCPAMNVNMYEHPITREQMSKLQSFGYVKIDCVEKRLACGDTGMGAMAAVETIANKVVETLLKPISKSFSTEYDVLARQPRYPIMSTNVSANSPLQMTSRSPASSLNTKSLAPGQMSMHNYINVRSSAENLSNRSLGDSGPSQIQRSTIGSTHSLDGLAQVSGPVTVSHRPHPNLVTSLQNLQAINKSTSLTAIGPREFVENGKEEVIPQDTDEDIIDQATPEDCNSEYSYNGFDPTDLLEQSLVTGKTLETINGSTRNDTTAFHTTNTPISAQNFAGSKKLERRPVFNTSKILDSCFDQDRNCYVCSICNTDYKNRKSIARHLKEQHLQGDIYKCIECDLAYKRREKLIKHNKLYHGKDGI